MVGTELFKRKKVSNQERGTSLTLEQLKQTMNTKFEEIYDYLDKIQKASLDEGGVINGNVDINGNITKNGNEIFKDNIQYKFISGKPQSALDDIPTLLGEYYQDRKPYFIMFNPKVEDNMIFDGAMFMVTGYQNGPDYGEQTAYCYLEKSPKKRYLYNGVWREWKSLSEKSIATLSLSETKWMEGSAWTNIKIPLDIFSTTDSDLFEFSNNGILLKKDAKLSISATVQSYAESAYKGQVGVNIFNSTTNSGLANMVYTNTGNYQTLSATINKKFPKDTLFTLQYTNSISMWVGCIGSSIGNITYLTIQEV